MPGLGGRAVERVVDIAGYRMGVFVDDGVLLVLGHGLVNVAREGVDRLPAPEGFLVFFLHALSPVPVTGGAMDGVDLPAIGLSEGGARCEEGRDEKDGRGSHSRGLIREEGNDVSPGLEQSIPPKERD